MVPDCPAEIVKDPVPQLRILAATGIRAGAQIADGRGATAMPAGVLTRRPAGELISRMGSAA